MDPKKDHLEDTGLTTEDLAKGLDQLDEFITSNDGANRKDYLLQKAMDSDLEGEERTELFDLMGGTADGQETRGEEIIKSMGENESIQQAFEVSDFLREQHEELSKSLSTLAEYQERSETRQHDFNLALARTVSDTGKLVKSMSERLGSIEQQPARGPRAVRTRSDQVLQKSFGGEGGIPPAQKTEDGPLNRKKILRGLDGLMEKSMDEKRDGLSRCNEDISLAVATFEQTSQISKPMLEEIQEHLAGQ